MAEEGLPKTADMVHKMADNLERGNKAAQGIDSSFLHLTKSLFAFKGFDALFERFILRSDTVLRINKAISKENLVQAGIKDRHLGLVAATAALTGDLLRKQRQFNQDLIEANSSFEHRNKLLTDTLVVQAQAGISFDKITNSARALVHYGMDAETTFEANLEIVAKLEQGLGVSANESARLASIVERQVKGSFEGVAQTIAQIVNDTSLAGDEVARLATNIGTALGRLRPGLGAAGLPEVVKLVGRYEGALKEIGGAPGAFTQLLTQLTTPEGIVGAGALGASPEFLATSQGVQEVMTRFAKYGEMLVGQSSGWERQMRLQALAQQFNVSADQANQMMLAIKRANEQQSGAISLNDRWKEQLNATNSGISRLTNSLLGALQHGLLPFVNIIGYATNKLADFTEWLLQSKTTLTVVGYALLGGVVVLGVQLWGLVTALWHVTAASVAAQAAIARQAAAQLTFNFGAAGAGAAGTTGLLARSLGLVGRGLSMLFSPIGLLVAAAVGAGYVLHKIYRVNKDALDEQRTAQKIILDKSQMLEEQRQSRFYSAARYGNADDVMKAYASLVSDATMKFQDISDPIDRALQTNTWLKQKMAQAELDLTKGMVTRGMYTPLEEIGPEETKREDEMRNLQTKMLKVNEDQKALAERDIRWKMEQQDEMSAAEFNNRVWYLRGRYNPLGNASDYYSTLGQ